MNLRALDLGSREYYVYSAYDADGRSLYVGRTNNLRRRWREHKNNRSGVDLGVRFRVRGPYTFATARAVERWVQVDEQPVYGLIPGRRQVTYPPHRSLA
jgi:hypothetical protein